MVGKVAGVAREVKVDQYPGIAAVEGKIVTVTREADGNMQTIRRTDRRPRRDLETAHEIEVDNSRVGETTEDVSVAVAVDHNLLREALVDSLDCNEQSGWIQKPRLPQQQSTIRGMQMLRMKLSLIIGYIIAGQYSSIHHHDGLIKTERLII